VHEGLAAPFPAKDLAAEAEIVVEAEARVRAGAEAGTETGAGTGIGTGTVIGAQAGTGAGVGAGAGAGAADARVMVPGAGAETEATMGGKRDSATEVGTENARKRVKESKKAMSSPTLQTKHHLLTVLQTMLFQFRVSGSHLLSLFGCTLQKV